MATTTATSDTPLATESSTKASTNPICGPADNGTESTESTYIIPSTEVLTNASVLPVLDKDGKSYKLKDIFTNPANGVTRNLVIFIRHFGCSVCQQYLKHIAADLSPEKLAALESPARITIIGCGEPSVIPRYIKEIPCPWDIYTDPTLKLYSALGMTKSLDPGPKVPEYNEGKSMLNLAWKGLVYVISDPMNAMKVGDFKQIGGEFLWVKQADGEWKCTWAHKMRSTRDHAELSELKSVLEVK